MRKQLKRLQKEQGLVFVHGSGRRKSMLQKTLEKLDEFIARWKDYQKKLRIMGTRNSFAKTDPDATFMRMKEDAMRNGQLKPAYNIHCGVDAEFITWATVGPQPTDTTTLIPFLEDFHAHTKERYAKVIADAGYESEENYVYLKANGQAAYIKPNNYERAKTRAWKNDIGRFENMT
ncbi:transposase, partial [Selenomonas sputigena]